MSIQFDQKLIEFNRWYQNHRHSVRSIDKDVEFLQAAMDKAIGLLECANKDLRAYERGSNASNLLAGTGIRL